MVHHEKKKHQALIIVDMQNDFMPGGALPTKNANKIIPYINDLIPQFSLVVATKDWHPKNHLSFAANHPKKKPGEIINVDGLQQILWPIHCVQNTVGAEFAKGLHEENIDKVFYKGIDPLIDSYSTFFDNAHKRNTGLADFLRQHHIDEIMIVGVATDYCVLYSVLDALELGFCVKVLVEACKPINLHHGDEEKALERMRKAGAEIITANL